MAEVPGQQTVDFSVLVRKAAEASVSSLKELCETAPDQSDTEKKIGLLKYILKTRQRLLRLLALSKWCRQVNCPFFHLHSHLYHFFSLNQSLFATLAPTLT